MKAVTKMIANREKKYHSVSNEDRSNTCWNYRESSRTFKKKLSQIH